MEGFQRWLKWRMDYQDLDHYGVNNTYRDYAKMTKEQRYWYSLIFGMTYQSEMAWVIYSQFPNFEDIDLDKLKKWNIDNLDRQRYTTDTRYNKGRITEQVASMKKEIAKSGNIVNYFESKLTDNEHESFENIYNQNLNLHKFGRMTSWITCQVLFETANLPIRPNTMLAWEPSTKSPRSGLFFLYDRGELREEKLTPDIIDWVKEKEVELYEISKNYIGEKHKDIFSNYLLESHLCQYKKLLIGGDYPGHSSGDHVTRANYLSNLWPEVDFTPFYKYAVMNQHPDIRGETENKALRELCLKTGQFINMHNDYDDLPDMYLELGIKYNDPQEIVSKKIDYYMNNDNSYFQI